MVDLNRLNTEKNNPNTLDIDIVSTEEVLQKINNEDKTVAYVVEKQIPKIATIVDVVVEALKKGGRLLYLGAGTSGRLGVLDASECPPTYGVSDELVIGLMAGGKEAMFKAKEGVEDSLTQSILDLKQINLSSKDVLIGLAASGRTPYVVSGLKFANEIGAISCSISCVEHAEMSLVAKYPVELITGPEVVTGSTRMKAGTAQKLALNMISTAVMIKLGKTYKNYMVDVQPSNKKLVKRAIHMVSTLAEKSLNESEHLFHESGQNVKVAILMGLLNIDKECASNYLSEAQGKISEVINRGDK